MTTEGSVDAVDVAELLDRAGFEHVAVDPPAGGTRSDDIERGE